MLLTTGIAALSRKVKDDRERKKEARQGTLNVGPSDVAKRAFEGQTSRMLEAGSAGGVKRSGTKIKYEDPNDIGADSPVEQAGIMDPEKPPVQETRRTSQLGVSSPVESESAEAGLASPMDQTLAMSSSSAGQDNADDMSRPLTYSSRGHSLSTSAQSSSSRSKDETVRSSMGEMQRLSTPSTNSIGTHAVRVKTKGATLSSGFPYHNSLFDLKVHPDKWAAFTEQVVHTTKVSTKDSSKAWAAATATAMSGAILTSIYMKKSISRAQQERTVKSGISDMSDGGLGSMLQKWNDQYFTQQGLFVHLELSESAMKHEEQRSKAFRKPALLYSKREERERKEDERKYVIVVTKLDADGAPTEAIRAMENNENETGAVAVAHDQDDGGKGPPENIAEMPGDTHQGFLIPELPGDDGLGMAELPGGVSLGFTSEKAMQPPPGFAELEPDETTKLAADRGLVKEMEDTSLGVREKDAVVGQEEAEEEKGSKEPGLDKDLT